jgi:hypothetical protein
VDKQRTIRETEFGGGADSLERKKNNSDSVDSSLVSSVTLSHSNTPITRSAHQATQSRPTNLGLGLCGRRLVLGSAGVFSVELLLALLTLCPGEPSPRACVTCPWYQEMLIDLIPRKSASCQAAGPTKPVTVRSLYLRTRSVVGRRTRAGRRWSVCINRPVRSRSPIE